jgi:hypothetical protein
MTRSALTPTATAEILLGANQLPALKQQEILHILMP